MANPGETIWGVMLLLCLIDGGSRGVCFGFFLYQPGPKNKKGHHLSGSNNTNSFPQHFKSYAICYELRILYDFLVSKMKKVFFILLPKIGISNNFSGGVFNVPGAFAPAGGLKLEGLIRGVTVVSNQQKFSLREEKVASKIFFFVTLRDFL